MIKLDQIRLNFDVPEWRAAELAGLSANTARMRRLAGLAGTSGDQFQRACERLISCNRTEDLLTFLLDSLHIRAYTYLLNSDDAFSQRHFPSRKILDAIQNQRWPISRLMLTHLVRTFANQFGKVSSEAYALL